MSKSEVFGMLFRSKWNIPRAARELGMQDTETGWEELKAEFRAYCSSVFRTENK